MHPVSTDVNNVRNDRPDLTDEAPPIDRPSSGADVLLVQLSDPHIVAEGELLLGGIDTATFLREAIEHVNRLDPQPDLVLLTGDLVNEGRPEEYEHLRELLEPLRAPFHLVPGNHDLTAALRAAFPDHVHGDGGPRRRRDRGPAADRHARQLALPGARRLPRPRAARVARPTLQRRTRPADGRRRPPPAVRDRHRPHGHDGPRRRARRPGWPR